MMFTAGKNMMFTAGKILASFAGQGVVMTVLVTLALLDPSSVCDTCKDYTTRSERLSNCELHNYFFDDVTGDCNNSLDLNFQTNSISQSILRLYQIY